MSPPAQRFASAVQILVGDGPVKQRLASAFSLHLADVEDADLPAGMRREFADLKAAVSRVAPAGRESRVRASVRKMSSAEAASHAATIVRLYVDLANGLDRSEPLKIVTPARKTPRFLAGGR